ncbi:TPA: hypothetical protein N0F65_006272 [Lagenidium giganteum]|uniref:Ankyrin repeat protein n=1 Tax=Lagenidium giganteum TaxID=4803 RepID=A0AAV2Z3Q7_9STRA|nr:TPA: hypothetical protein N0F65_006272 [Lagenidium giganteum]
MFSFIADKLNVKNIGEMLAPTMTPDQELHAAIEGGLDDKFVQLLDEMNVSPHVPNAGGHMPIHTAAYHGRVRMLEYLLDRGIDVNTTGPRDNTPLHFAASQGHDEAVRFLVNRGANPAMRNRNGKTPYDICQRDLIRQFLLPLQFRHEDPAQAAAMLPAGITPSTDPLAPKPVIAPPPMAGASYGMAPPQQQQMPPQQHQHLYAAATHSAIPRGPSRITRGEYRPIQADGFGTSVGNEELTAKFGNTREVKVTAPPPAFNAAPAPVSNDGGANPFSARTVSPPRNPGGYPGFAPPGAPSSTGSGGGAPVRGPPQFKIFNPRGVATNTSAAPAPGAPAPATGGAPAPYAPVGRGPFGAPTSTGSGSAPTSATPAFGMPAHPTMNPPRSGGAFMESVPLDGAQEQEVNLSATASVLQ